MWDEVCGIGGGAMISWEEVWRNFAGIPLMVTAETEKSGVEKMIESWGSRFQMKVNSAVPETSFSSGLKLTRAVRCFSVTGRSGGMPDGSA